MAENLGVCTGRERLADGTAASRQLHARKAVPKNRPCRTTTVAVDDHLEGVTGPLGAPSVHVEHFRGPKGAQVDSAKFWTPESKVWNLVSLTQIVAIQQRGCEVHAFQEFL